MIQEVKPETNAEKMDELTKEVGSTFFEYGKLHYEIELKQRQLADTSIKLHNLNNKALELQKALDKEAKAQALKVALPTGAPQ